MGDSFCKVIDYLGGVIDNLIAGDGVLIDQLRGISGLLGIVSHILNSRRNLIDGAYGEFGLGLLPL